MSPILCCPEAALEAVLMVASHPMRNEVVCLLLNDRHNIIGSMVINDAPRDIGELTSHFSRLAAQMPRVKALSFAFCLAEKGVPAVQAAEHIGFLDSRERFECIGIDLVDWFLIGGGKAISIAEMTDAESLWRTDLSCASRGALPV
jgi:hypothetical protein